MPAATTDHPSRPSVPLGYRVVAAAVATVANLNAI